MPGWVSGVAAGTGAVACTAAAAAASRACAAKSSASRALALPRWTSAGLSGSIRSVKPASGAGVTAGAWVLGRLRCGVLDAACAAVAVVVTARPTTIARETIWTRRRTGEEEPRTDDSRVDPPRPIAMPVSRFPVQPVVPNGTRDLEHRVVTLKRRRVIVNDTK